MPNSRSARSRSSSGEPSGQPRSYQYRYANLAIFLTFLVKARNPSNAESAKAIGTTRWRISYFMRRFQQLGLLRHKPEIWIDREGLAQFIETSTKRVCVAKPGADPSRDSASGPESAASEPVPSCGIQLSRNVGRRRYWFRQVNRDGVNVGA